jgi:hypothetical protein
MSCIYKNGTIAGWFSPEFSRVFRALSGEFGAEAVDLKGCLSNPFCDPPITAANFTVAIRIQDWMRACDQHCRARSDRKLSAAKT